ncbi:cellulase family glycosylhydrolase [Luteolibacter sp. Populi]|uniref:cellulase family glycosylhydrolase n=1 Tax=Luteolibacter sp. Populi TaxID=3230487 RepID=UPI003467855C
MNSWLLPMFAAACLAAHLQGEVEALKWIRANGDHFAGADTKERFVVWGVNYDRDDSGRLIEDYWEAEWAAVVEDFGEIKALGANLVRIHLQLPKFMDGPEAPNAANLARLGKLVRLAEQSGLYLDVTGLGCYYKKEVPGWYAALPEAERWQVQEHFWQAIAKVCRDSPAVFCYCLMNEPVLPGEAKETEWLTGELDGKSYVQRIALDLAGRSREEVAQQWVAKLSAAIRKVDERHMITVGVIPWAQVFKGAKPIFYAPEVHGPLDFVSVHFYPKKGELEDSLAALKVYEIGKPLVVEEIFPLHCGIAETDAFIEGSRSYCDGWVSFYWGKSIEENERKGNMNGSVTADWLKYFRSKSLPAVPDKP